MLKIAFNQSYIYPLEENHRFPMIKYELIPEQLIRENTCVNDNFFNPGKIDKKLVLLTHQEEYFNRFKSLKLSKVPKLDGLLDILPIFAFPISFKSFILPPKLKVFGIFKLTGFDEIFLLIY